MTYQWRQRRSLRLVDAIQDELGNAQSARAIKRSLEANSCRVNGKIERFASAIVASGDLVELTGDWLLRSEKSCKSCNILFEHSDFLAIDKPTGVVCSDAEMRRILKRPLWLAHRLDKDTTGVLLLGKTFAAAQKLQAAFSERAVCKSYLALADGVVSQEEGRLATYFIKRGMFQGQTVWGSNPAGQGIFAETNWKRLSVGSSASLILCMPVTGRTHQIRVHLAEMGHPILTDRQYASRFFSKFSAARPLLHARQAEFSYGSETFCIKSDLPADFQAALTAVQIRYESIAISHR